MRSNLFPNTRPRIENNKIEMISVKFNNKIHLYLLFLNALSVPTCWYHCPSPGFILFTNHQFINSTMDKYATAERRYSVGIILKHFKSHKIYRFQVFAKITHLLHGKIVNVATIIVYTQRKGLSVIKIRILIHVGNRSRARIHTLHLHYIYRSTLYSFNFYF